MLKPQPFAHAVAAVVGVAYVLCRVIAAVAPQFLFNIGQSWFHTISLEAVRATQPMSLSVFILGLVSSVVLSWIAAYAVATLYNRWAKV
ncbi:MAG: DUF5676 family membrane protein [bacterium]|nr:DUF5676 family membrane protein [bacterium]